MKKEMKLTKDDFRVEEFDGEFKIQRKYPYERSTRMFWWKKVTNHTSWRSVDNKGNYLYSVTTHGGGYTLSNFDDEVEPLPDLQSALDKIDLILNPPEKIYHYLKK
jgi:hypothetical protein